MNPKTLCDQNTPWQLAEMVIELRTEMAGKELMDAEGTSFAETIVRDNATLKSENEKQAKELSNCRHSMMLRRGISDIYLNKIDKLEAERDALRTALGSEKEILFDAIFNLETELAELQEALKLLRDCMGDGGDLEHAAKLLRVATNEHGVIQTYGNNPYAMSEQLEAMATFLHPEETTNENPQT